MFYELKKFYKNPVVVILSILALALSVILPLFFIHNYTAYRYVEGNEIEIKGMEGLKYEKEKYEDGNLILTEEKVHSILKDLQDNSFDELNNVYPGMGHFFQNAFSPFGEESFFDLSEVDNSKSLKEAQRDKIISKMNRFGEKYLDDYEIEGILKAAENIKWPLDFQFNSQWPILIKTQFFVYYIIAFIGILISSKFLSYEYENEMDLILITRSTKNFKKIIKNKIMAIIVFLLFLLILSTIISVIVITIPLGKSGWDSQLQTIPEFFSVPYPWTIGSLILHSTLLAILSIIAISLLGGLFNTISNNTMSTLIILIVVFIFPLLVGKSNRILDKIIQLFSVKGLSLLSYIDSYFIYKIFKFNIMSYYIILIKTILLILICILLINILSKRKM